MKKHVSLFLFGLTVSVLSMAQVAAGDLLLGGSFGYNQNNGSGSGYSGTSSNLNVNPRISMGVGKNSILGVKTGFSWSKTEDDDSRAESSNTAFSAGAFWRKLLPVKGKFGWYPELGGGFSSGKSTNTNFAGTESEIKSNGFTVGVVPGLYYAASPSFLLNLDFGGLVYSRQENKYSNGDKNTSSNINFGLFQSFQFGFDYIIGKRK